MGEHRHTAGFKDQHRLEAAKTAICSATTPLEETETIAIEAASDHVLAASITANRALPHYARAAMDGFAVKARDTFQATSHEPVRLDRSETAGDGKATRVHTGSALPSSADAVVMIEHVSVDGDSLFVYDAVTAGENVGEIGEDIEAGEQVFESGHRLRAADIALLKAIGVEQVAVYQRPDVAVVPTGDELVQSSPAVGEMVETNGLMVADLLEQWGSTVRYRDIVGDDHNALKEAIERDLDADVIVTTGGSSVGERDLLPDVLADLGEVLVHGVAIKPGHPLGLGHIESTPIVVLPGYPVSCYINAQQVLRPLLAHVGHRRPAPYPSVEARLARKVPSEPGVRTFLRVEVEEEDGEVIARPIMASGAGILSSVTRADGWVVIPESTEGLPAETTVTVEYWEAPP